MDIRMLQYFLAVVQEENISKAADVLHVTQPTLSRQMSQLEDELGAQLFIRGRHLTLTDAGSLLYRRAEEVSTLMEKIETEFAEKTEVGGVIAIGSGGLAALQTISPVLDGFRRKYPKVQYRFYTNSAEHVKERLEQGLLDFGFLLGPIDVTKFDYIRMPEKERWGLLMQASHPLAHKDHITKEDLSDIPLITSDRLSIQKELATWLGKDLAKLNIFATYNIITNVAMLVDSGIAAALTIEGAVNLFEGSRMVFRPLYPELAMSSVLAWKKFHPDFSTAGKFLAYLKSMQ